MVETLLKQTSSTRHTDPHYKYDTEMVSKIKLKNCLCFNIIPPGVYVVSLVACFVFAKIKLSPMQMIIIAASPVNVNTNASATESLSPPDATAAYLFCMSVVDDCVVLPLGEVAAEPALLLTHSSLYSNETNTYCCPTIGMKLSR